MIAGNRPEVRRFIEVASSTHHGVHLYVGTKVASNKFEHSPKTAICRAPQAAAIERRDLVQHWKLNRVQNVFRPVVVDGDFFAALDVSQCAVFFDLSTDVVVACIGVVRMVVQ